MKKQILLFLSAFILLGTGLKSVAQEGHPNIIKINLGALRFGNFSLQYERAFHKNLSFALGVRFMPSTAISGLSSGTGLSGDILDATLNGWAVTPEFRWYPGEKAEKQAPRGFYIAPYLRYSKFTLDMPYSFVDTFNVTHVYSINAQLKQFGFGVMIGAQWVINERVSIDWWILGATFGSTTVPVTMTGSDFQYLTPADRADLEKDLEAMTVPNGTVNAEVTAAAANLTATMPYLGIRAGLCIGIAF